eukprot:10639758-Alexandrium_andersonii.AAC.1
MATRLAPEALEGAVCTVFRADSESDDEAGRRARRRRFSRGSGGAEPPRYIDRTESIDGTEHDGDRTDRT